MKSALYGLTALLAGLLAATAWPAQADHAPTLNPKTALTACKNTVSDECVVRHFKNTHEASVIRGRIVFQNYCVLCHGREGKGDGRAARLHQPPPFNLTLSVAPRDYIDQIIRKGGEAMNRGKGMPPWADQLTDEQINDLSSFLWSIRVHKQP